MRTKQLPKMLLTLQTALCMGSLQMWANPVTVGKAEQTARKFLASRHRPLDLATTVANSPAAARSATPQQPLLHVFNVGDGEGFVILSGDDATTTDILAYSDHGTFCYDSLPPNARAWIDGYAEQIADLRQCGAPKAVRRQAAAYPEIPELLTSEWGQDEPYNDKCPLFWGGPSVTGCVATAMAQVLYYHYSSSRNTVSVLQDDIPDYECGTLWAGLGRIKVGGFPKGSPIDWVHMKERYDKSSTAVECQAVADLMAYCGASVETDYKDEDYGGSGASAACVPAAAKKYFGYTGNSKVKYKKNFSEDNWEKLIYRELFRNQPVIICGSDQSVMPPKVHALVCDGYSGGKFHINWGWSGDGNGYYYLKNLKPVGVKDVVAFNSDIYAVVDFYPGEGTPFQESTLLTVTEIKEKSLNSFNPTFKNCTTGTYTFEYGLMLYKNGSQYKLLETRKPLVVKRGEIVNSSKAYEMNSYSMESGNYIGKFVCRVYGSTEWQLMDGSDDWYIEVVVASNGVVTSKVHPYDDNVDLDPELLAGIATPRVETQETVYTLTGRKVAESAEAAKQLPAGIYVAGGRKIIVK